MADHRLRSQNLERVRINSRSSTCPQQTQACKKIYTVSFLMLGLRRKQNNSIMSRLFIMKRTLVRSVARPRHVNFLCATPCIKYIKYIWYIDTTILFELISKILRNGEPYQGSPSSNTARIRQWVCAAVFLIFGFVTTSVVPRGVCGVTGQLQPPHLPGKRLGAQRPVRGIHLNERHTLA